MRREPAVSSDISVRLLHLHKFTELRNISMAAQESSAVWGSGQAESSKVYFGHVGCMIYTHRPFPMGCDVLAVTNLPLPLAHFCIVLFLPLATSYLLLSCVK